MGALGIELFDFEWKVDVDYVWEKLGPGAVTASQVLLGANGSIVRGLGSITRKGGSAKGYKPAETRPWLHRHFAEQVIDPPTALRFVQEHGFLGSAFRGPEAEEENMDYILRSAKTMRTLLARIDSGRETLAFISRKAKVISGQDFKSKELLVNLFNSTVTVEATVRLALDKYDPFKELPAPQVVPRSLLSWMYLRVLEEISEDAEWRKCANQSCPDKFFLVHLRRKGERKRKVCQRDGCRVAEWRLRSKRKRKDN